MSEFLADLSSSTFLQYAFAAALFSSIACGTVGSFVTVKRITYIAGAIAHCVLGGMGVARYLQRAHGLEYATPMVGAVISGIVSALIIGFITMRWKEREDTVLSALWASGMAIGILFISQTPGYAEDLMSYLFGNILLASSSDLVMVVCLDVIIVVLGVFFYNKLLAVCFDEEFARLRGIRVELYYQIFLCVTALTVVLLIQVVGIVLVIALLTIPAATASQFTRRLHHTILVAILLCLSFTASGLVVSYSRDLPAGAVIIIIAACAYLAVLAVSRLWSVFMRQDGK